FAERLEELARQKNDAEARLAELEKRWTEEKKRVEELRGVREKLETHAASVKSGVEKAAGRLSADEVKRLQAEIAHLNDELGKIQGDKPLLQVCVDAQAVAEVVSGWTGIPVGKVVKDEIQTVLPLKDRLEERVIGQSHALEAISQRIRTSRAKLE